MNTPTAVYIHVDADDGTAYSVYATKEAAKAAQKKEQIRLSKTKGYDVSITVKKFNVKGETGEGASGY